ncbi:MAG: NUDIX domain-containing protein [Bacteroidales bacterium]|nr:NUDIX domain-containing protein [Bacteroidales bacterium]
MNEEQNVRLNLSQKYKVFFNDYWILFGDFKHFQANENEGFERINDSPENIISVTNQIKSGKFDRKLIFTGKNNPRIAFDFFCKQFKVLEAAGGIVRNSDHKILMIKRFGKWDFPKGKIEKDETSSEAALREVEEETSVNNLQIQSDAFETFHLYPYGGKWILKKTYWYSMSSNFGGLLVPQTEEDIEEVLWIHPTKLSEYLNASYASLRHLILLFQLQGE